MQELFSSMNIAKNNQGWMRRCHLDHHRPNTRMHISNGTSIINDKDNFGHQTVLYPSN